MTGREAHRRLSKINAGEFPQLTAFAREIAAGAKAPAVTLIDLWKSADAKDQQKAEAVLAELAELAVNGWLDAGAAMEGARRGQAWAHACQACLSAQRSIVQKLQQMMDSKTPMPQAPDADRTEEREPPSRECDEAYLLARWLMNTSEPELDRSLARKRFLWMTPARRDAEIASYRKSGRWAGLADALPGEVEP